MAKVIKGFFFDLDGTLVNTHEANFHAYSQAIKDTVSQEPAGELKAHIKRGESSNDFLPELLDNLDDTQISAIQQKKKEVYPEHLYKSELNEFLSSFLEQMSEHHTTALVTTAKRASAEAVLKAHGIDGYFDFCIFGDDVEHKKPHPEAYINALERAGLQPDEVIVFEDSEKGMQAAISAGMQVIQIRSFYDA